MDSRSFEPTTINEYFHWIEDNISPETKLYQSAQMYMNAERSRLQCDDEDYRPFLSVITRTQGKRPAMLRETLLSLTAQSNTNFELLIMGHNLSDEQEKCVTEIIEELPQWMQNQTKLIHVRGGTRTTPINQGFENAQGKYITILDDDDVAFENWVEAFYQLYLKNKGKILHTYSITQDWEIVGDGFPRAVGSPSGIYCRDFKFWEELMLNYCPPGALSFPAYAFKELGIRFDETMTTTEDWDYLMRCAFVTGVANSQEVTFLYRRWVNAENSATVHNQDEWDQNYGRIIEKFINTPIVMPIGSLRGVIDKLVKNKNSFSKNAASNAEVYYDDGTGFSANKQMHYTSCEEKGDYQFFFKLESGLCKGVSAIRFDPVWQGFVSVRNFKMCIVYADNSTKVFTTRDVKTNGCVYNDEILFLKSDPQIVVKFPSAMDIKCVWIAADTTTGLTDDQIAMASKREAWKNSLFYRAVRKGYYFLRKVKNKLRRMF